MEEVMSEVMKWIEGIKNSQREYHKKRIDYVLKNEVPQHILATKEIADDLTVGEDGYTRTEVGFFFKEGLVNKLMHLAYLHGKDEIDKRSFELGKNKAIEMMQSKINEL
jgi:hypothetical protein